jgi:carbonic anhydrase
MNLIRSLSASMLVLVFAAHSTGCATRKPLLVSDARTKAAQAAMTPEASLRLLKEGNARFVRGELVARDWSALRKKTAAGQYPHAVILSCLDSRASSELVFDQGLGDVFNARVAGNVLNDDVLGSMEFACKAAGAKLVVVVGHTSCGAVKGACSQAELGHLTALLAKIRPSVAQAEAQAGDGPRTGPAFVDKVAVLNVEHVMAEISSRSPILRGMIESGEVGLVGGIHHLDTGEVVFLGKGPRQ